MGTLKCCIVLFAGFPCQYESRVNQAKHQNVCSQLRHNRDWGDTQRLFLLFHLQLCPILGVVVGRGSLRKDINEIRVCSSLILSTCFISETTQTCFDCMYSCIRAVHKSLTGEFDFGLYQSDGTFRGPHFELFNLPSPKWLCNDSDWQSGIWHHAVGYIGTVILEEHAFSLLPVKINAASFSEAVFTYRLNGATTHKTSV
jgi:hypothetical protein